MIAHLPGIPEYRSPRDRRSCDFSVIHFSGLILEMTIDGAKEQSDRLMNYDESSATDMFKHKSLTVHESGVTPARRMWILSGRSREVYNGPGSNVWEQCGKMQNNGQRPISLSKMSKLNAEVADTDRLTSLAL